jgi:LysM repeat protein
MANPFAKMGVGGKRGLVVIVILLLAVTGVGATAVNMLLVRISPGSTGLGAAAAAQAAPNKAAVALPTAKKIFIPQTEIDILVLRVDEYWQKGDWNGVIEILTALCAADGTNPVWRDRLYQAHVNFGWLLIVNQKAEMARTQFLLAQQIAPSGMEAQEGLRIVEQLAGPAPAVCALPTAVPPLVCVPTACPVLQPTACPLVIPTACPVTVPDNGTVSVMVQRGDTLFGLARRFNTTVEAIMAANRLCDTRIFVCQILVIPVCPPTPCPPSTPVCATVRTHVVRRGDNLFRLALQFNTSVVILMRVNGLQSTTIRVGQTLIIP